MKIKIKKWLQTDSEMELNIPTVQSFYFETGIRRSICCTPIRTIEHKEMPEEIWKLNFICVYQSFEAKIDMFDIHISSIRNIFANQNSQRNLIEFICEQPNRTKEQFLQDFNNCLASIKQNL